MPTAATLSMGFSTKLLKMMLAPVLRV